MSSRSQVIHEVIVKTSQGGGSISEVIRERSRGDAMSDANCFVKPA